MIINNHDLFFIYIFVHLFGFEFGCFGPPYYDCTISQIFVETFNSGPQWWTNQYWLPGLQGQYKDWL